MVSLLSQRQQRATDSCRRLSLLKRLNPDAHAATVWLRNNRDLFEARVHEPLMLNIKLRDQGFLEFFL